MFHVLLIPNTVQEMKNTQKAKTLDDKTTVWGGSGG